jgi:hypothetical protein
LAVDVQLHSVFRECYQGVMLAGLYSCVRSVQISGNSTVSSILRK